MRKLLLRIPPLPLPCFSREGMRSFGRYEFAGADTAVDGFPHMNDVYHHISLGVPERYRAQSGVTFTANASCGIILDNGYILFMEPASSWAMSRSEMMSLEMRYPLGVNDHFPSLDWTARA